MRLWVKKYVLPMPNRPFEDLKHFTLWIRHMIQNYFWISQKHIDPMLLAFLCTKVSMVCHCVSNEIKKKKKKNSKKTLCSLRRI